MSQRQKIARNTGFLLAAAFAAVTSLVSQAPPEQQLSATYSQGVVHVTIPYEAPRAGSGTLRIEVLDPEDAAIGSVERKADAGGGKGAWREEIALSKPVGVDELVWHRLRYRFAYDGSKDAIAEGTESISRILRMPVLRVIGQEAYFAGGDAAARVIVTDSRNQPVEGLSAVRVELAVPNEKPRALFSGRLNRRGTSELQFHMPAGLVGSYALRYAVDTPIGSAEFGETDLPAGTDDSCAGAGVESREPRGERQPAADVRAGGFTR
jgi:hypothetical protein